MCYYARRMTKIALEKGLRTWIEINKKAILHNFSVFKKLLSKKTRLMAVVKSNAYGHGIIDFSKEMEKLGADFLGVDSMTEARALRREGIKIPILVLGYTIPVLFEEAAQNDISLTISSFESLDALKKIKSQKPLKVHIKVDTGMHRQGFLSPKMSLVISRLQNFPTSKLTLEGLYTHFASAKNPAFPKDTRMQIEEFEKWIVAFRKAKHKPIVHATATGGTLLFPESHFDMVRIGIGLYGLWPAPEVKEFFDRKISLKPALVWKSIISEIKKLPKGSKIGYDLTEMLEKDSVTAIVPIGYWHGYPRSLSSVGRVIVGGKECKVLGRVSMDMLTIDISNVKTPHIGDEVIIKGDDGAVLTSVEGIANLTDSSWYEVVTRLNPLIKRVYY